MTESVKCSACGQAFSIGCSEPLIFRWCPTCGDRTLSPTAPTWTLLRWEAGRVSLIEIAAWNEDGLYAALGLMFTDGPVRIEGRRDFKYTTNGSHWGAAGYGPEAFVDGFAARLGPAHFNPPFFWVYSGPRDTELRKRPDTPDMWSLVPPELRHVFDEDNLCRFCGLVLRTIKNMGELCPNRR